MRILSVFMSKYRTAGRSGVMLEVEFGVPTADVYLSLYIKKHVTIFTTENILYKIFFYTNEKHVACTKSLF